MNPLVGARVVLGVSGSVAAYKAADLASRLCQLGAVVDTIVTAGAATFVQPLTFTAITRRQAHTDAGAAWTDTMAGHVALARDADLLVVAPASANAIARLALGLADDLLGMTALATAAPLVIAPAMEHRMFHHPATQGHLTELRRRGATIVGPATGHLASGADGDGRLAARDDIVGTVRRLLGRHGSLAGRRLVVSAGGTREPLDPVRYLGNRSSGTMGLALAQAALDRGAEVEIVAGPIAAPLPFGATITPVETAAQMRDALVAAVAAVVAADALIMAAAVADFRPATPSSTKIKKRPGDEALLLDLRRNPDILADIDQPGLIKIGFAAETEELESNAERKLRPKGLSLIVANDAVATIGSEHSTAVLISPDQPPERLPTLPKTDLADVILDRLETLLNARDTAARPC